MAEGERPSNYFCNLEKYNFTEKTIRKLQKNSGENIYNQKEILEEIRKFYGDLFAKRDSLDEEFSKKISEFHLPKLNQTDRNKLDGKLKVEELSEALRNMKNEKSPGIDGFPAEFFTFLGGKLKLLIVNALNESYDNGIMSISLRHGLISCLPKGQKPRMFSSVQSQCGCAFLLSKVFCKILSV